MKRTIFLAAMVSLIGVFAAATPAKAQFLGNFCWNMSPFIDNIEVAVVADGTEFLLHGKWVASGSYHAPVVGNADTDITGKIRYGVHGTFVPGTGIALNCAVDATLDGTLTGPWALECEGGFVNSGTLFPTACPIPLSGVSGTPALNR
ncbi:MAG: hypothetical protein ACE5JS_16580 [Nitrospinota bacterium]